MFLFQFIIKYLSVSYKTQIIKCFMKQVIINKSKENLK